MVWQDLAKRRLKWSLWMGILAMIIIVPHQMILSNGLPITREFILWKGVTLGIYPHIWILNLLLIPATFVITQFLVNLQMTTTRSVWFFDITSLGGLIIGAVIGILYVMVLILVDPWQEGISLFLMIVVAIPYLLIIGPFVTWVDKGSGLAMGFVTGMSITFFKGVFIDGSFIGILSGFALGAAFALFFELMADGLYRIEEVLGRMSRVANEA